MPSIKEQCVCQICICGRHHCGEEIKFPALIEESEPEEDVSQARVAAVNEQTPRVIESETNNKQTSGQEQPPQTSHTATPGQRVYFKFEKKIARNYGPGGQTEQREVVRIGEEEMSEHDDESELGGTNQQRKTWQTSPNEVEQLTRSLSRLRTDIDTGLHYEKFIEKERNSMNQHNSKSKTVSYQQPYLSAQHSKHLASRMSRLQKDSSTESFLPPLTGFSDSDSSFGSFSCFGEGECKNQMHCICETLKNCDINGQHPSNGNGEQINYIDGDQWIVTKPERVRPKDNLRLDGPMDLNTTFRSTYDETARRIAPSDSDESKRSSRASKHSPNYLYLGTRQGRTGHTPQLRSARRRRARNRPHTSLKLGGDGCYHTINQDSYKNFVIVDGQAKTISPKQQQQQQQSHSEKPLKLPRVVQKKRSMKGVKVRKGGSEEERKTVRVGDDEFEKVEKKSLRITNNDVSGESDVEKMKIIHVVKRPTKQGADVDDDAHVEKTKSKDAQTDSNDLEQQPTEDRDNWTIDHAVSKNSMRRQFTSRRYQDHIQEMGLLERSDEPIDSTPGRKHTRRLHENSDKIVLPDNTTPPPRRIVQRRGVKVPQKPEAVKLPKTAASTEKVVDGHVVDKNHSKPFIFPQRIHRNKNESSSSLFRSSAEMDFNTTSRQAYGRNRPGSGQTRYGTAGKRILRSAKRRNLFRPSSNSMFSNMHPVNFIKKPTTPAQTSEHKAKSVYNQEFGDHLYCPALDVAADHKSNESFKFTGEAGGHKYYLSSHYDKS